MYPSVEFIAIILLLKSAHFFLNPKSILSCVRTMFSTEEVVAFTVMWSLGSGSQTYVLECQELLTTA